MNDYDTAVQAIENMLKTGRQIFPKYFDNLDYDARKAAIAEYTCPLCKRFGRLTGAYKHIYGTEKVCGYCDDVYQYNGRELI